MNLDYFCLVLCNDFLSRVILFTGSLHDVSIVCLPMIPEVHLKTNHWLTNLVLGLQHGQAFDCEKFITHMGSSSCQFNMD